MRSPKYQDLRSDTETNDGGDSSHEDSSVTEYGYEGKANGWWHQDPTSKTKYAKFWTTLASFRSILDTILLLVILVLLVERTGRKETKPAEFEFAGDLTGFAPRCTSDQRRCREFPPRLTA